MRALEDTTVGREWAREFSIIRWDSAVASGMVDDATDGGAPLNDADESPTIAHDRPQWQQQLRRQRRHPRDGGALGRRQKAGPITQQKDGVETTSKDEDDME